MSRSFRFCLELALCGAVVAGANSAIAQRGTPDQPQVTVHGQTYTPQSILSRNMGTEEDQTTAFTPHKIIGNVYYVGTRTLSSFLITTPQGHILINSTYERNVRTIEKSVAALGFKFGDIKILLGTHAHGDHQEGDALFKQLTGAQVLVMQEDVPALEAMKPGGKPHPIDRRLRDGEEVTLGGTTLVAHLTPGHTHGATTWTMKAQEGGKTFNVVFASSYRSANNISPDVENEFNRTFKMVRALPCDVPLGDHPAQYNLAAKYARVKPGAPNPFIDPANCWIETDIQEAMFRATLQLQQKNPRPAAAAVPAAQQRSNDDDALRKEVNAFMDRYWELWSAGQIDQLAERIYHPFGQLSNTGHASIAQLKERFPATRKALLDGNYGRSNMPQRNICILSPTVAVVSGKGIRYLKDGGVMAEFGWTYTLLKDAAGWRMVAIYSHDVNKALTCS